MPKKHKDPRIAAVAGAMAGGVEASFTWPTEFAKTHLQLQKKGETPKYTGIIDVWRQTVKRQGVRGLYRGLSPVLIMSFPKASVRFGSFTIYSRYLRDEDGKMSVGANLMGGLAAGVSEALLVVTPQETLKVRLIDINKGLVAGTAHILRTEGIRGLYQGLPATIGKQASNQAIRFVTFSEYKRRVLEYTGADNLSPFQSLLGGMTAGCCSVLGNNPVDTVKTRMQGISAQQYTGTIDCIQKTLRNEGPAAFYKGAIARMGRVVPGQGMLFMSYEYITQFAEKIMGGSKV